MHCTAQQQEVHWQQQQQVHWQQQEVHCTNLSGYLAMLEETLYNHWLSSTPQTARRASCVKELELLVQPPAS